MSSDDERDEKELDLTSPEVVTKYKSAAEIVNKALQVVLAECKPGAKIVDLCDKGDAFIKEQTGNMYKSAKKKIDRGVAFPTCVSVNNVVGHFSPLPSDESVLAEGDMVKIDMGCHIDGFIALVGHTHVLQEGPVTGRKADVIAAANTAAEVALRLVRPGKKNHPVTEAIQKVAEAYNCKIVEGVLSHQMKQNVIDGSKVVLSVMSPETRVDDVEFEENEVYAIDIVASTGDGKPKLLDEKQTTIYRKDESINYQLKMKASRSLISEVKENFPHMPFTSRSLEEKRARLGLVECVNHGHLQPYPVLYEKPGDFVAQIKFTVLLMPNGSDRITSHTLQEIQPTKTIDDPEIKGWLALGIKKKKGGGKKKKAKKAGEKGEASTEAEPIELSVCNCRTNQREDCKGIFDCLMEQHSNDISQEQARESLIAIAYTSPDEVEESLTPSDVKPVVATTNGVSKTNSEAAEKLRSELISISYDESPSPSPDVSVSPALPNGV